MVVSPTRNSGQISFKSYLIIMKKEGYIDQHSFEKDRRPQFWTPSIIRIVLIGVKMGFSLKNIDIERLELFWNSVKTKMQVCEIYI